MNPKITLTFSLKDLADIAIDRARVFKHFKSAELVAKLVFNDSHCGITEIKVEIADPAAEETK